MGSTMAKCPKCSTEVSAPLKSWILAPKGRKPVTMGLYKCQSCGAYFRTKAA
ncbi:MAG: chromatin protein Cren7 [Candidatus Methanomethylicia archaeon]